MKYNLLIVKVIIFFKILFGKRIEREKLVNWFYSYQVSLLEIVNFSILLRIWKREKKEWRRRTHYPLIQGK